MLLLRCFPGHWSLPDLYLDLQGYQQFVQRLPLDVAISGEFQAIERSYRDLRLARTLDVAQRIDVALWHAAQNAW